MITGYYEIQRNKEGHYFFTLNTHTGKLLLTSEIYASHSSVRHSISSVQSACSNANQYNLRFDTNNRSYFVLQAKDRAIIGKSRYYNSENAAQQDIKLAIQHGCSEEIRDFSR